MEYVEGSAVERRKEDFAVLSDGGYKYADSGRIVTVRNSPRSDPSSLLWEEHI